MAPRRDHHGSSSVLSSWVFIRGFHLRGVGWKSQSKFLFVCQMTCTLSLDNVRKRPARALCGQVQEGPNHLTVPRRLGSAGAFISPIWNKSMEHEVKFFLDVCIFMNRYLETNNLNRRRLHKVF